MVLNLFWLQRELLVSDLHKYLVDSSDNEELNYQHTADDDNEDDDDNDEDINKFIEDVQKMKGPAINAAYNSGSTKSGIS